MMNGLKKCFGYGKLLKQLFIILLISCSIFFVDSFVKADYYNYGSIIPQFGDNDCRIGDNLGISCSKSSYLLTSYDSGYNKSVNSLFWTSDGIGFYYKGQSQTFQGLIYTGFYICSGDFTDFNTGTFYLTPDCYNKVFIGSYENLINKLLSKNPLYVGTGFPNGYGIVLSLVYDDFYFTEFVGGGNDSFPKNGTYLFQDMGISGQDYDTLTFGNNVLSSPIGSTGIPYPINSGNSDLEFVENVRAYYNSFVYSGFLRYGYYTGLCYSNFNIDTLGVPASGGVNSYSIFNQFFDYDKDDGFYDTGATVLDLKDYYFSGFSDDLWIKNIINIWSSSYNRFNIDWYIGKPRGFWSIPYNINNYIDNSDSPFIFNGLDYMCFCRMSLEGFDSDGLNSCSLSTTFKDYIEDNADVIIKGIDNPANITNVFEGFDRLISVIMNYRANVPNGISGILPTYIIFGFFLFLLLYGLKR